uniref:FXYD domain-containing ion transport regulator n=1 Tax=Poecilia reticulata TaxID=8081 RepID=A0A3P9PF69_POERE
NVPFLFLYFFSVLFSIFMETEANYERLRIGGLVFAGLLIIGSVFLLVCNINFCNRLKTKIQEYSSGLHQLVD